MRQVLSLPPLPSPQMPLHSSYRANDEQQQPQQQQQPEEQQQPDQQRPYIYRAPLSSQQQQPPSQQAPQQHNQHHQPLQQNSPLSPGPLLPPIQHFEAPSNVQSHQQFPPTPAQHPPPYSAGSYPFSNGGTMSAAPVGPHVGTNGLNGLMPIPMAQPTLQMVMRKPAKEVKRRTKTGCLTCRRRRIKCDEGHPICRNCVKSKRECLGYDPIFKQQPGPPTIQPAPSAHTSSISTHSPNGIANQHFSLHQQHQPYQPSPSFPGTGGTFVPNHSLPSPNASYAYGTSLDSVLGNTDSSLNSTQGNLSLQPVREVKFLSMDQLFSINDIPPQWQQRDGPPPPLSSVALQEVDDFYLHHYAGGLNSLFETTWYSEWGARRIKEDPVLCDFVSQCSEQFKAGGTNSDVSRMIPSLEARLVWQLATMPRMTPPSSSDANQLVADVLPRIQIVEQLLTGRFLPTTLIPPRPRADLATQVDKYHAEAFWFNIGRFTAARDDTTDVAPRREITDAIQGMRNSLWLQEHRDVLYSVAIVRHYGGRITDFDQNRTLVNTVPDSEDEVNKLKVAQQFIENEDRRGTNQVIQTICRLAIRSWTLNKRTGL